MSLSDESSQDLSSLEQELASWSEESSDGSHDSLALLVLLKSEGGSSSSPGLDGSEGGVPADGLESLTELVSGASLATLLEVLDGS